MCPGEQRQEKTGWKIENVKSRVWSVGIQQYFLKEVEKPALNCNSKDGQQRAVPGEMVEQNCWWLVKDEEGQTEAQKVDTLYASSLTPKLFTTGGGAHSFPLCSDPKWKSSSHFPPFWHHFSGGFLCRGLAEGNLKGMPKIEGERKFQ